MFVYLGKYHFLPGGGLPKYRSKGGIKRFFQIKEGEHLYFLKETKYFVKHFRFQRKGLSDATQERKLQWGLLSQCKNVQLHHSCV